MLFARLQLGAPDAQSFLIAAADSSDTSQIAQGLAESIARTGQEVRLVDLVGEEPAQQASEGAVQRQALPAESKGNLNGLAAALGSFDGYTVMRGADLRDHGPSLLATRSSDGVVLVASRGKTPRMDLARVKAEVERAGSLVVGAVLKK